MGRKRHDRHREVGFAASTFPEAHKFPEFPAQERPTRTAKHRSDSRSDDRHANQIRLLSEVIGSELDAVLAEDTYKEVSQKWGVTSKQQFTDLIEQFKDLVRKECMVAEFSRDAPPRLFVKLRQAFVESDIRGLSDALRLAWSNFLLSKSLSQHEARMQQEVSDLSHPEEWFPATRALQRKVILHVGPTNSGKTYHALKRLEEAESGIFAGPLRLLAHEVYTRFNAKNVPCALVTGEERRMPPGFGENESVKMRSCTVEMIPLNQKVDVCVIDEIQMIGDTQRGWAWTQALLGVQAKEIHLCGEERTVPLIKDLCALVGDEVEVHHYKRLSALEPMNKSLNGNLKNLVKGDCVILFSRLAIHQMKRDIEKATGKLCAVVYGSLPPETRAQQAALFNDPDNDYDFLAASDAIGMGLNLSIKRIIFEAVIKHNGKEMIRLAVPQVKQIAGRAGRYRTAAQATDTAFPASKSSSAKPGSDSVGLVTTLHKEELKYIQKALPQNPGPILTAGLFPSDTIVQRFASIFPSRTPLSYILIRLHEIAKLNPRFHLCELRDQLLTADMINKFDLTVTDRLSMTALPAHHRMRGISEVVEALAKCIAEQSGGDLVDIHAIPLELLDQPEDLKNKSYLVKLEILHNSIDLYLWLSYRFAGVFRSVALGFHVKGLVEEKINRVLAAGETKYTRRTRPAAAIEDAMSSLEKEYGSLTENEDGETNAPIIS